MHLLAQNPVPTQLKLNAEEPSAQDHDTAKYVVENGGQARPRVRWVADIN
jgi:hypothetical protein